MPGDADRGKSTLKAILIFVSIFVVACNRINLFVPSSRVAEHPRWSTWHRLTFYCTQRMISFNPYSWKFLHNIMITKSRGTCLEYHYVHNSNTNNAMYRCRWLSWYSNKKSNNLTNLGMQVDTDKGKSSLNTIIKFTSVCTAYVYLLLNPVTCE